MKTSAVKCHELKRSRLFLFLCAIFVIVNLIIFQSFNLRYTIYLQQNSSRPRVTKFGEKIWNNKTERKILLWTTFFLEKKWVRILQEHFQRYGCDCNITGNRDDIQTADAVIFHALDLWFWEKLPTYRSKEQIWILFVAESPPHIHYTGMTWKFPPYIFNWTMSYRSDSTVYAPYGRFRVKKSPGIGTIDFAKTKSKMTASLISNCYDDAKRYVHLKELAKYTKVDFYGRCGDKICPRSSECDEILKTYRFKITFENSNCRDYITEKFWNALYSNSIPLVNWKKDQRLPFAPPRSYINIFDFRSMRDVADYLNFLSTNDTEYNSFFQWRRDYEIEGGDVIWHMFCKLCRKLKVNPLDAQVVDYLSWMQNDTCQTWSVSIFLQTSSYLKHRSHLQRPISLTYIMSDMRMDIDPVVWALQQRSIYPNDIYTRHRS
ncbi:hypothetical protein FSP39_003112 [Pinctada imbricata]|uniref:Fucosyltransferase n=1 Tax=Pinctada imbricata TaxID=66713 RepID=A0AA89BMT5_PINIB|nr:hypothetical protein FSP39_003112 [Pinctada imbricata]